MSLHHLLMTWKRNVLTLLQAEIPMQSPAARLTEAGSLLDRAEQGGAASSLSVALLQMGLIGHLPDAFPAPSPSMPPRH